MQAVLLLVVLTLGCQAGVGFQCGTEFDDKGSFRECTRSKEVCICATNSCAVRIDSNDECASHYKYVEAPFADPEFAGKCVEMEHMPIRIEQQDPVKSCEARRVDAGVDGGVDAPIDGSVAP